jgi:membrane protein
VGTLAVVLTGDLARQVGDLIGLGSTAVTVWSIAKWPVAVIVIGVLFALLYWAAPNVRHPGFRWLLPGAVLAIVVWIAASVGFAVYVANFGSYNETYGTLGGVIVFLVWLWITNAAVLLGAELNAELERQRQIEGGLPPDEEPFLEHRDTTKLGHGP